MKRLRKLDIVSSDDFDILAAIWILASNDDNPIMTYQGITYRLGLPKDYDAKRLVKSRPELFRSGLPAHRLKEWKAVLLTGRHLPSWIRDIQDGTTQRATIEALTSEDVFRSQFRAERDALKSPVEIIDWGLQHIDRLRKAFVEVREEKVKRWASIRLPLLSMLIALVALISTAYIQIKNNNTQAELKRYEVTFRTKQDSYSSFMRYVAESFESGYKKDLDSLIRNLDRLETSYYAIEPFLDGFKRGAVWGQYQQFSYLCYRMQEQPLDSEEKRKQFFDSFLWYKQYFRTQLYDALFKT
jgi:hypothetical protein